jgi:hypothetical protein
MVSHDLLPAKSVVFLDATYVPLYIQTLICLATQPAFRPRSSLVLLLEADGSVG